ncbi:hypothetical protein ACHAO7_011648 [Fusarium culmorum]
MPKPSKPSKDDDKSRKKHRSKDTKSSHHSNKHGSTSRSHRDETDQVMDLYCAVYQPRVGNYYHWAFAMHRPDLGWAIFEVVQDVDDGPFRTAIRDVNPSSSARCLPLVPLARIYSSYAQNLASQIREIPVEGRPALWNCQEYVLEIWDLVWQLGAIDQNTYEVARQNLMPYFGPIQEEDDEYEHEEVPDEDDNQPRQYQSAEFISDSGSD